MNDLLSEGILTMRCLRVLPIMCALGLSGCATVLTHPAPISGCTPPTDKIASVGLTLEGTVQGARDFYAHGSAEITPKLTSFASQASNDADVRNFVRCLMQKEQALPQKQIAWYETKFDYLSRNPTPEEFAAWLAKNPFPPEGDPPPPTPPPFDVAVTLATGPENASLLRQDWDVFADDFTRVRVEYELTISKDEQEVICNLAWDVWELDGDHVDRKTHIRSEKSFSVYRVPAGPPNFRIAGLPGTNLKDSRTTEVAGRQHQEVPLPNVGALSGIRVRFDGPTHDDRREQQLRTDLRVTIELKPTTP